MQNESVLLIPIGNVRTSHDVQEIQLALTELENCVIQTVEVNFHVARIQALKNPEEVIQAAVVKIRELGFYVATLTQSFPLIHMSCASCASSAEATLMNNVGVVNAAVNYANSSAKIEWIDSLTTKKHLKNSLQDAGYDLLIETDKDAQVSLEQLKINQYKMLKNKVVVGILLGLPLFVLGMFFMHVAYINYWMWFLSTPLVFYVGKQFFVGAWRQLKHRKANMDTLVALSTGIAYVYSVFVTLFFNFFQEKNSYPHVYFEAAGMVIVFVLLGKLLEERAKGNTATALKKLIGLQAKSVAIIQSNGRIEEVLIEDLTIGAVILVKPGESIAVDGIVINGKSYVDESMMSGEAIPMAKKVGDTVFAGTINQQGSFQMQAEKVGSETLLAQIIKLVEEAQGSKASVQQLVDKIAAIFVPIVFALAIISAACWWIFGGENAFTQGIISFVTVLVIACPCALGLATPTALMVGIGKGAEQGILIKDAESIELAQHITTVVLDKTGTITQGSPSVTEMRWFVEPTVALQDRLVSIEQSSEHPLADAIVKHVGSNVTLNRNLLIENHLGKGIEANDTITGERFFVGNRNLLMEQGIVFTSEVEKWMLNSKDKGETLVYFAADKNIVAGFSIEDELKETSILAIQQLLERGIEVYMLTGDNEQTAAKVASKTGINQFHANVLPTEKYEFVKNLQAQGKIVAMVGDGVNDSSALAQADVSIAMGKGSDIAKEVAKMTILTSDLTKIPMAIDLSKATALAIRQNLFWAFIYNLIGIPIAAGVLYPFNGFLLDPMWAGAAMAFSSVSVVLNSLRLKNN